MKRSQFLEDLQLFTGASILIFTSISVIDRFPVIGYVILGTGVMAMIALGVAKKKKWQPVNLKVALFLIEGVALGLTAMIAYLSGKQYLHYGIALAAMGYVIAAIVKWRSNRLQVHERE